MVEGSRINSSEYNFTLFCMLQLHNFAIIMLEPNILKKVEPRLSKCNYIFKNLSVTVDFENLMIPNPFGTLFSKSCFFRIPLYGLYCMDSCSAGCRKCHCTHENTTVIIIDTMINKWSDSFNHKLIFFFSCRAPLS